MKNGLPVLLFSSLLLSGCNGSALKDAHDEYKAEKKIKEQVNEAMEEDQIPGMSVVIVSKSKRLYAQGFGYLEEGSGNKVSADTPFRVGEISQAIMGAAIMHARDHSILSLDMTIADTLESYGHFSLQTPEAENLTLRHLATHTGGISDNPEYQCTYFTGDPLAVNHWPVQDYQSLDCSHSVSYQLAGFLESHLTTEGVYYQADQFTSPGQSYQYSQTGAALAGYSFEQIAGVSLNSYTYMHLFSPLGMNSTRWHINQFDASMIARPHIRLDGQEPVPYPLYQLATGPEAGLISSAKDIGTFLQLMMNNGKHNDQRIIQASSAALMQSSLQENGADSQGVFWQNIISPAGRTLKGHRSSEPGTFSLMFYDPDKDLGVVILANSDDRLAGMPRKYLRLADKLLTQAEDLD